MKRFFLTVTATLTALILTDIAGAADAGSSPSKLRVFGPSQIQETYRILLDREALLLESIADVIKQKDIQDGEVLVTAGSVSDCTYHYVTSTAVKPKDEF